MVTLITEKLQNHCLEDKDVTYNQIDHRPAHRSLRARSFTIPKTYRYGEHKRTAFVEKNGLRSGVTEAMAYSPGDRMTILTRSRHKSETSAPTRFNFHCNDSNISQTPPEPPPPKKRHCRSLSIPTELSQTDTSWKPSGCKLWTPVTKLKQGQNGLNSTASFRGSNSSLSSFPVHAGGRAPFSPSEQFSTPPESPIPRPASASSGFFDTSLSAPWLDNSPTRHKRTDSSVSEAVSEGSGSLSSVGSSLTSTPELPRRRVGLPRARSQPCVLHHDRKGGLKRRREEERPTIDFVKMKESSYDHCSQRKQGVRIPQYVVSTNIRSSRSLASFFIDSEFFLGLKPIMSSPCDSTLSSVMITPSQSPTKDLEENKDREKTPADLVTMTACVDEIIPSGDEGEAEDADDSGTEGGDSAECDRGGCGSFEEPIFPIDDEIDIDQIERN
ncbi:protein FAM53A-like isoform X1 [Branchiostoma floridae x Branchiostoma belcheri]